MIGLLLFSTTPLLAAKMYKWVDDNGEVHFSQTPPVKGEDKVKSDSMSVQQTKASGILPRMREGYLYCGELQLPKGRKRYPLTAPKLNKRIDSWTKSKKRSEESLKRYLAPKKSGRYRSYSYGKRTTFNEQLERLQKPVRQYQCAIDWANGKIVAIREGRDGREGAYSKAKNNLNVAKSQQREICGHEPPEYNTYGKDRDRYLKWEKCIRRNSAVVRKMESKVKDAERALGKKN